MMRIQLVFADDIWQMLEIIQRPISGVKANRI